MNLAQEAGSWRTGKSSSCSRSHPAQALFPILCNTFPKSPGVCGSRWSGSRSNTGAQRPFLPFCPQEGGTALELQRDPTALCSSSKPPLPHTHFSLSLWSDGVRGNGQERAGAGIELHPGHSLAPNPGQAACVCFLLLLQCLGSSSTPSSGNPFTGKSRSQRN